MPGQRHPRSDDHAPYRAQSEGGIVDEDAKVVPRGWVCVGYMFEDEVGDGDVCEWLKESGDYPHLKVVVVVVVGGGGELSIRGNVGCEPCPGFLLPFSVTPVHPTSQPTSISSAQRKKILLWRTPSNRLFHVFYDTQAHLHIDHQFFHFSFSRSPIGGSVDDKLNQRPFPPCILLYLEATLQPEIL